MTDTALLGAQRLTAHVAEYDAPRTPDDGEPDRVTEVEVFLEADGAVITSESRIAEVLAWIAKYEKGQTDGRR